MRAHVPKRDGNGTVEERRDRLGEAEHGSWRHRVVHPWRAVGQPDHR